MNRKQRISLMILSGVLLVVILAVAGPLPAGASRWLGQVSAGLAPPAQSGSTILEGTYGGMVELDWVLPGEFSDSLPTPGPDPTLPDLGTIDLALQLSQAGSTVSGYVDLEYTLVYSTGHTVDGREFGPSVQGTFDGVNLTLTSERISLSSAGLALMRQFHMTGALEAEQENTLSGEYRETLWGYGQQPLTVVGRFRLVGQ